VTLANPKLRKQKLSASYETKQTLITTAEE
jgi:hypothetical protein